MACTSVEWKFFIWYSLYRYGMKIFWNVMQFVELWFPSEFTCIWLYVHRFGMIYLYLTFCLHVWNDLPVFDFMFTCVDLFTCICLYVYRCWIIFLYLTLCLQMWNDLPGSITAGLGTSGHIMDADTLRFSGTGSIWHSKGQCNTL